MVGIYSLSAFSAMVIHSIEDNWVIVSYNYDGIDGPVEGKKTKNIIHYTTNGRPYFIKHGRRYHLDNFQRVEA